MNENENGVVTGAEQMSDVTVDNNTNETKDTNVDTGTITMSKIDFDKALQSAEDKARTKYVKENKELKEKLSNYQSAEKSESDRELERRVAEIEARERSVALRSALQEKNLNISFADYLKDDIDIESFNTLIDKVLADKVKTQAYVPSGHQNNVGITQKEWDELSYSERVKIYKKNPELVNGYIKKK